MIQTTPATIGKRHVAEALRALADRMNLYCDPVPTKSGDFVRGFDAAEESARAFLRAEADRLAPESHVEGSDR